MNSINCNSKNSPQFGMKFDFIRLTPDDYGWHGADREFFNTTYQLGLIAREVSKLKPKSDVFELQLGLPQGDVFPDENGIFTTSYKMLVNIKKNKKTITTYDLSEENIKLDSRNYQDRLEVHKKGPFLKIMEFVENLLSE